MTENQTGRLLILTELPRPLQSWTRRIRAFVLQPFKKLLFSLFRKPRFLVAGGPLAVSESLKRGLTELGIPYRYNERIQPGDTVCVLSDPQALRYAIAQKEKGLIDTLIAGPNVLHNPLIEGKLMQNSAIDRVLVPSLWTKDWWASLAPALTGKLVAWAAGVSTDIKTSAHKGGVILFIKDEEPELVLHIQELLRGANVPFRLLRYGTFLRSEYIEALKTARFMIYLSHTESQGIALAEAWMADVPTLVWNPGFFEIGGFSWRDPMMSAPYLQPECGTFFKDTAELDNGIKEYLQSFPVFTPRRYASVHLSDSACALKYLALIKVAKGPA